MGHADLVEVAAGVTIRDLRRIVLATALILVTGRIRDLGRRVGDSLAPDLSRAIRTSTVKVFLLAAWIVQNLFLDKKAVDA